MSKSPEETVSKGPLSAAEKARQRAALLKKMQPKGKPALLFTASERSNQYFLRRPCGITQLDIDTGGGLPAGTLVCLSGIENAGKSTLLYLYCAMHQRIYGAQSYIALAHVEGALDYDHMRKLGFIVRYPEALVEQREADRLRRGLPKFTKEERAYFDQQVGEVDLIGGATGEQILETVLAAVESDLYGIVAVDSITALETASEADREELAPGGQQGGHASLLTKFSKKYFSTSNQGTNKTTLIFTQQVRANRARADAPGHMQKYIPDAVAGGSYALRHAKTIDVTLSKGEKEREKVEGKSEVIGRTVKYKITKGKAGTHDEIAGEYSFTYEDGFFLPNTILIEGLRLGAISEVKGKIIVHRNGAEKPLAEFESKEAFETAVEGNLKLHLAIRRELMSFAGKECTYVE